jgi:hypothetical protein
MIVEGRHRHPKIKKENGKYVLGDPIYDYYEMQWIGEFNPKMINVSEALGTYRAAY